MKVSPNLLAGRESPIRPGRKHSAHDGQQSLKTAVQEFNEADSNVAKTTQPVEPARRCLRAPNPEAAKKTCWKYATRVVVVCFFYFSASEGKEGCQVISSSSVFVSSEGGLFFFNVGSPEINKRK